MSDSGSGSAAIASAPEDEAGPIAGRHYGFLAFLTLLNVMNFVDRQLLANFANFIVPDLGLSNTQFGLLTGLVFLFFYSAMGVPMGMLADRVNRTRLIALGLGAWSALTAVSGAARGFWSLAAPRMFIGIGESIMTPTSMSLLSDRFPKSRLGFASGTYYMGVPIGQGLSLLIVGYLGEVIGWRACFYLLGAIGVVLAVIMWSIRETPRKGVPQTQSVGFGEMLSTFGRTVVRSPALMLTIGGGVCLHLVLGAAAFDQLWYVQERGFDRADIAVWTGWIGLAGGVLGNLFGGMGGDAFLRRTGLGRATFLFWIMVILAPINIAYRLVPPDSIWFWIGIFVGYFQLGCFYGPTFSSVQELVPPQVRATVVGFYIMLLNIVGLGIGITLGGVMIDALIDAGISEPYTKTLVVFTLISFLAAPLFLLAGRRYQRDRDRLLASMNDGL